MRLTGLQAFNKYRNNSVQQDSGKADQPPQERGEAESVYNKSGKADQSSQEIGRAESVYSNKSGKADQPRERGEAESVYNKTVVKQTNHTRGVRLNQCTTRQW